MSPTILSKLKIAKETVRSLSNKQLESVQGGRASARCGGNHRRVGGPSEP